MFGIYSEKNCRLDTNRGNCFLFHFYICSSGEINNWFSRGQSTMNRFVRLDFQKGCLVNCTKIHWYRRFPKLIVWLATTSNLWLDISLKKRFRKTFRNEFHLTENVSYINWFRTNGHLTCSRWINATAKTKSNQNEFLIQKKHGKIIPTFV